MVCFECREVVCDNVQMSDRPAVNTGFDGPLSLTSSFIVTDPVGVLIPSTLPLKISLHPSPQSSL